MTPYQTTVFCTFFWLSITYRSEHLRIHYLGFWVHDLIIEISRFFDREQRSNVVKETSLLMLSVMDNIQQITDAVQKVYD